MVSHTGNEAATDQAEDKVSADILHDFAGKLLN